MRFIGRAITRSIIENTRTSKIRRRGSIQKCNRSQCRNSEARNVTERKDLQAWGAPSVDGKWVFRDAGNNARIDGRFDRTPQRRGI